MSKSPYRPTLPSDAEHLQAFAQRLALVLNMRRLLGKQTISQADVAREMEALGVAVSDGTISRWFQGKFWPSDPRNAIGLARVVGVDPGWLYYGEYTTAAAPEDLRAILAR